MAAILYEVRDGVATITIDRPEKRNAMSFAVLGEFIETTQRAGADPEARVVIVTGAGGAFCAGTDLSDLASRPPENRGLRGRADETERWWPLVTCRKPVIAAVDGAAVGMGAEFTSQCDVRIASTRARFAWNFSHRGLVPDTGAGTWLLPKLLGHARALELLYSGRFVDAHEALALGYVLKVVEPEELLDEARALAASFLQGSPLSHRLIKELVYQSETRDLGAHMDAHTAAMKICFASEDHREGVASFLERRPAKFVGR
ncbi:MAG TPA: enoyl-CoA hydratase-related protein [Myxococcota bacterium]|nr:enoyl-CoA hydratase-related protein [Myxococcota bacterium]